MSTSDVPSVLDAIVAAAYARVEAARARVGLDALERQVADGGGPARASFLDALARAPRSPVPGPPRFPVIAECKRRSPSRGVLCRAYDPVAIARQYAEAGAAAVSVLTEPGFFDGHLEHLAAVHAAHPQVPLLRKDFVVDEYQIAEAVLAGASAVLLIVAALDQATLVRLLGYAGQVGIDVLTEVHDEDEARRAIDAGAAIVGVNNRNLKTLEVSIDTSVRVVPLLASARVRVAESGLRSGADLAALRAVGYDAFLVGERFMTEARPGDGLARMLAEAAAVPEAPA